MDTNVTIPPLFRNGAEIMGRFQKFTGLKFVTGGHSTPDHTPTTLSLRLSRLRPQVYEAYIVPESHWRSNKVAVKAVYHTERSLLENEWLALQRLNALSFWLPWLPKIAPSLRQDLRFFKQNENDDGVWFIAYDWLDTDGHWEQLKNIVEKNPLKDMPDGAEHMNNLRNTLITYTHLMHLLGIFHGDNKDEHIFVYKENGVYQFDNIRVIDFGTSYLKGGEDWKGGSIGFSRSRFWNEAHRQRLSIRELRGLDWYGVYATLYYAYTGECFPTASPAYSKLTEELENQHLTKLRLGMQNEWKGKFNEIMQDLVNETVDKLCSPDSLGSENSLKSLLEPIIHALNQKYQFTLAYGVLFCGAWNMGGLPGYLHYALMTTFIFIYLFSLHKWKRLSDQQNQLLLFPLLIYISFLAMTKTPFLLPILLPLFLISLVSLFVVIQKGDYGLLTSVSFFSPAVLSAPLSVSVFPMAQAMLMPFDKKKHNKLWLLIINLASVVLLDFWLVIHGDYSAMSMLWPLAVFWSVFGQIIYWLRLQPTRSKMALLVFIVFINIGVSTALLGGAWKMLSPVLLFFILMQILRIFTA